MKFDPVEQARDYLLDKMGAAPQIGVIMGSGASAVDEILRDTNRLHYITIPNCPVPRVAGHRGQVVFGKAGPVSVLLFEGRVHHYEGYTMDEVTFCTRVIGRLGAQALLLMNAAGAIDAQFSRGHFMLIRDHINLMGANPLTGPNEDRWGPRFVDQTSVYDPGIRKKIREAAEYCGIKLAEGVYAAMAGPTYETPAEIHFLKTIGADAVGMSMVPEAIVARHMGMKVAGLSMLVNLAAGLSDKPIEHKDVLEGAAEMNADAGMLLQRFLETYEPA
jgi:purine-nucleoside phosphorylase